MMSSADESPETAATPSVGADEQPIECRPTRWFFRRMGLMALLLIGLSLYFFYDGKYGYPKVNQRADVYDWFHDEVLESYQQLDEADRLDEWPETAAAGEDPFGNQGWPMGADGGMPRWPNYAASLGWSSAEPKRFSPEEIREQFHWGIGTMIIGLLVLGYGLSQIPSRLRADSVSLTPPRGRPIRFDQVYKVDTRKWKQKGLAYAHYKKADGGQGRVTIDDLKYGGAQQVLDRLLANFSGELVEKVEDSGTEVDLEDQQEHNAEAGEMQDAAAVGREVAEVPAASEPPSDSRPSSKS